jgi:four helix bundle protein
MDNQKQINNPEELYGRIKKFVVGVVHLVEKLPNNTIGYRIGGQLIDSSGSIGANYAEAQSSRSKKEFGAICGIALKEAKETLFWLEIIKDSNITKENLDLLIDECQQLSKILAKIIINCFRNQN